MRRIAATLAATASLALALAGCAGGAQQAGPATSAPAQGGGGAAATATGGPAPSFVPGGSAEENRAWFDHVNQQTLAADPKAGSHALVDALAAAGFAKADMQVTYDRTSVDLEADYVIVSVQLGGQCLIGQRAPGGYASEIAAPLSHGSCLIGETQPIDW